MPIDCLPPSKRPQQSESGSQSVSPSGPLNWQVKYHRLPTPQPPWRMSSTQCPQRAVVQHFIHPCSLMCRLENGTSWAVVVGKWQFYSQPSILSKNILPSTIIKLIKPPLQSNGSHLGTLLVACMCSDWESQVLWAGGEIPWWNWNRNSRPSITQSTTSSFDQMGLWKV